VLILTRDSGLKFLGEATIAPITSTVRNIPTEVILTEQDGMKTVCAINLDHIQTVSKSKLGAFIAKLSREKMAQVKSAVMFSLDFDD
jgi:mRNA interferase MazF